MINPEYPCRHKILVLLGLSFVAVGATTTPTTQLASFPGNFDHLTFYSSHQIKCPMGNDDADVQFILYTRNTMPDDPAISEINDKGKLFNGNFDASKVTKFVIHGWLDNWKLEFAQSTVKAYLSRLDYNVIVVNWNDAENIFYPWSRFKVPAVGKIVAKFLDRLQIEYGFDVSNAHLIGHSLGAHVAGVAGRQMEGKIGKITGLDPALPLFLVTGDDTLRSDAANFVDVMHTCSRVASIHEPLGDVDFYPNGGGVPQPGCGLNFACSHMRSFRLYTEAIVNATAFLGTECTSWKAYTTGECEGNEKLFMNGDVVQSARGNYYLRTAGSPPYGLGLDS